MRQSIYLFNSPNKSRFAGGVFTSKPLAEEWISKYKLTGILTLYPVDIGVYDWAIENKLFSPKKEEHSKPDFISGFSSASQEHYHYENGICLNEE